ncbi:MAG: hypothetical protein IPJ65_15140 [Archangiaceae bacterium]|nr:hypothetical protein [Archangiaceae bacterium]
MRPTWLWCVGGLALPVMITSYASGIPSWPLALLSFWHHNDLFAMRRLWLLEGAVCLVALYRLVLRVADRRSARITAVALATSSAFVVPTAFLFPYETAPLALIAVGLCCWLPEAGHPGRRRLVLGALCFGLALLANLKAVFLFVPVAALLWRAGVLQQLPSRRAQVEMALAFGLAALPMLVFTAIDPASGFAQQGSSRLGALAANLSPHKLGAELGALFLYAADLPAQAELTSSPGPLRPQLSWLPMALAVVWSMAVGVAFLLGRKLGGLVSAAAGLMLLTFLAVSTLLYTQLPSGNYAPIYAAFGLCVGGVANDLHQRGRPRLALAAAALLCVSTAWNLLHRGSFAGFTELSFNADVQRALAQHLLDQPDRATPVLTTTYNQAGVLDSLGHGQLESIIAHPVFESCEREPTGVRACLDERWRWVLGHRAALPLRVVFPRSAAAVDHPAVVIEALEPTLREIATEKGIVLTEERRFLTPSGAAGVVLYRLAKAE